MALRRFLALPLILALAACAQLPTTPSAAQPARQAAESQVTEIKALSAIPDVLAQGDVRRTLLVLDIDDTLLTSKVFFGSDRWYEWQKSLSPGDPGHVPCKFDVIALNYEAGTQVATEGAAGRDLINSLQVDTLMQTARNPGYRGGTIRELQAAGYALPRMLGPTPNGVSFDFRLRPHADPTTLTYQDGVMMLSGQDKGETLLSLFRLLGLDYDRVVLVDDGKRNIDNMQAALARAGIDYHGLWYTRIDKTVDADAASEGAEGWAATRAWLQAVFPERLQRMEAGQCFY
ncbi:DUF2608 domain-containing protein [Luteimonas aestuarii]|nr:DUF2608 domain-containing protein [Luteimonas aestuarii]